MDMPRMAGIELARVVRDTPDLRDLPMILLSSADRVGEVRDAADSGIAAVLRKPARSNELRDRVLEVCGVSAEVVPDQATEASSSNYLGLRVLLVEDNLVNQKVGTKLLAKMGCEVSVAENGRKGLERLHEGGFDLVLMDCQMPEMDGYQATRELRRREAGREHLPVVAMTAHAMRGDREKCLEAGMDDYVTKPVQVDELRAAIDRVRRLRTVV
ncbi:MAG: response regulator [Planctomycetes bacterium]|nr:response regulator [Planctomycetota bacterium]